MYWNEVSPWYSTALKKKKFKFKILCEEWQCSVAFSIGAQSSQGLSGIPGGLLSPKNLRRDIAPPTYHGHCLVVYYLGQNGPFYGGSL